MQPSVRQPSRKQHRPGSCGPGRRVSVYIWPMIRHRSLLSGRWADRRRVRPSLVAAKRQRSGQGPCATPDSVVFRGNQRISETMLRGDAGISPGVALSSGVLQRAIKNLYATGQFDDIQTSCSIAREWEGHPDVRRQGASGPRETSMSRDQIGFRSTRFATELIFSLGDPSIPIRSRARSARIDSLYEAEGYPLATVRVDTTVVDGQLKLDVSRERGQSPRGFRDRRSGE